jgi:hypothetical protein
MWRLSIRCLLLCAAFTLLGLPGRLAQAAEVPANSPMRGAQAQDRVSATVRAKDPSQNANASAAGKSDSKRSPAKDAQTQRVRELIYFFRTYRVFCRDEEWAQTIRELAKIGNDAVPELVAELDRTDRDATLRSLAFSLRAIGDPRAVPALIRAIPKALRPPGSDCGVSVADPDLRAFMLAHQDYKDDRATHVACGRPVNEILSALERITKHQEPPDVGEKDPLRHVFLGGNAEQQAQQRALFDQRQNRWQVWWSEHWQEFVTRQELRWVELPKRDQDLVERAGLARFGPLFPTGAQARLGPVRMLRLTRSIYWNGKSHLDFDTGRVFQQYEGITTAYWGQPADFGARITTWHRHHGIDVQCQGPADGLDLQLWLIDDSRWDTLEAEIRIEEPLKLGREATSSLSRFEKHWTDFRFDKPATFLFTTREGGRGVVQVFPRDIDADRYRLRYRMWLPAEAKSTAVPPVAQSGADTRTAKSPGTPFGKIVTTTLELPAAGRECLLDLETGKTAVPPKILNPDELADGSSLPRNERFTRWCRDQGIDVFGGVTTTESGIPIGKGAAGPARQFSLIGLDMIEARILPETFVELTVEDAREILERMPEQRSKTAWMMIDFQLAEHPDTFAFKTREGAVGLLQMEATDEQAGKLTIRYRLEPRD